MLFLLGEKIRAKNTELGEHACKVCGRDELFVRTTESAWFTIFMIPVLPLNTTAHFDLCTACQTAYLPGEYEVPSNLALVKGVVAYMMAGYGMHAHTDLGAAVCEKVTGFSLQADELVSLLREFGATGVDVPELLKNARSSMNFKGKVDIVRAAYLVAYASCEMEFEDRLRINLMGTALELPLETVNAVVAELRQQQYLGIRRYLPTASTP